MRFKILGSISFFLGILNIAYGILNFVTGREAIWVGASILSGVSSLLLVWLTLRQRRGQEKLTSLHHHPVAGSVDHETLHHQFQAPRN